jgi:hypothetical protein
MKKKLILAAICATAAFASSALADTPVLVGETDQYLIYYHQQFGRRMPYTTYVPKHTTVAVSANGKSTGKPHHDQ